MTVQTESVYKVSIEPISMFGFGWFVAVTSGWRVRCNSCTTKAGAKRWANRTVRRLEKELQAEAARVEYSVKVENGKVVDA